MHKKGILKWPLFAVFLICISMESTSPQISTQGDLQAADAAGTDAYRKGDHEAMLEVY